MLFTWRRILTRPPAARTGSRPVTEADRRNEGADLRTPGEERVTIINEYGPLLRKTGLFREVGDEALARIAGDARLEQRAAETDIVREGESGEVLYVIVVGAVQVISTAADGREVVLNKLEAGSYFGEQALLPEGAQLRTATVRAHTDVELLAVARQDFVAVLDQSNALRSSLRIKGKDEIRRKMLQQSALFRSVPFEALTQDWCEERLYLDQQVVFREGEPGDRFYSIVSGSVALYTDEGGAPRLLVRLGPGQGFGELALLQQRPRAATAVAQGELRVLAVDGARFVELYERTPGMQQYLQTLQKLYSLAGRGFVTQHAGQFLDMDCVTTIYHLLDGTRAAASQVVGQSLFSVSLGLPKGSAAPESIVHEGPDRTTRRELAVLDGRLVGLTVQGLWPELGEAHRLVLTRAPVERATLEQFARTGSLGFTQKAVLHDDRQRVCNCLQLDLGSLRAAVRQNGCKSTSELSACTGAGTVCGSCRPLLHEVVGSASWIPVTISQVLPVAEGIRTFRFLPQEGQFRPHLPAQHLLVQALIDGNWVQRPYTITSPCDERTYREITVKREPQGYFSSWLFERLDPKTPVRLSEAQGEFSVDPEGTAPVVCLVAGIGMTPALAICRSLLRRADQRPLYIDYSVSSERQLAYAPELRAAAEKHPHVQLRIRVTQREGRIGEADIRQILERFPGADVYLCGPGPFQTSAARLLKDAEVPAENVHFEQFTPVGDRPRGAAAAEGSDRVAVRVGLVLLAAFFAQWALSLRWPWLQALQAGRLYRLGSGLALALFLTYQWYFPILRLQGRPRDAARKYHLHRNIGATAPLVYYAHSSRLGYGFVFFLGTAFLANIALGLGNRDRIADPERTRRYGDWWLIAHVALSVLTVGLLLLHVYVVFSYSP
jgi:ferredoxin-NADP reductase/CRP-like cAMP-binding protein